MTTSKVQTPDWQVAIIDGQPEVVVNAAAVARMVCASPYGVHRAMAALKRAMTPADFALIEDALRVIAND